MMAALREARPKRLGCDERHHCDNNRYVRSFLW